MLTDEQVEDSGPDSPYRRLRPGEMIEPVVNPVTEIAPEVAPEDVIQWEDDGGNPEPPSSASSLSWKVTTMMERYDSGLVPGVDPPSEVVPQDFWFEADGSPVTDPDRIAEIEAGAIALEAIYAQGIPPG